MTSTRPTQVWLWPRFGHMRTSSNLGDSLLVPATSPWAVPCANRFAQPSGLARKPVGSRASRRGRAQTCRDAREPSGSRASRPGSRASRSGRARAGRVAHGLAGPRASRPSRAQAARVRLSRARTGRVAREPSESRADWPACARAGRACAQAGRACAQWHQYRVLCGCGHQSPFPCPLSPPITT